MTSHGICTAHIFVLAAALFLLLTNPAQAGSGSTTDTFGPDRSSGAFLNITRQHRKNQNAQAIAVDSQNRVLVLNEWFDPGSSNQDCAVSRHLRNARQLDMDFTGPDELEATRRIALDLGGSNFDICTGMATDAANRVVVVGNADTGNGLTGFLVRLRASDGAYDIIFDNNGKLALSNLPPFAGVATYLYAVAALGAGKVLACGYVQRGTERNMLAVQFTSFGDLDTTFNGTGYKEIDFNGGGSDNDTCSSLQVLPNGNVVLAGTADDSAGDPALAVVRLTANGAFDTSFSGDGRLLVGNTTQIASSLSLSDVAYDAGRSRLLLGCNLSYSNNTFPPSACVVAVTSNGTLDNTFGSNGRQFFRFSDFHGSFFVRQQGGAKLRRLLMRDNGSFYVLGTHINSSADALVHGDSDVASLRMEADGSVITAQGYSGDGVAFHDFPEVRHTNLCPDGGPYCDQDAIDRKVADTLVDATWYRGNLLLLANRPRYPNNIFDHDGDGNLDEPGPIAPLVASIDADHLFDDGFEFDGLAPDTTPVTIAVPAGFGNYCSVRNASGGGFGLLPGAAGSDPCQVFLNGNPTAIIERAGLYSLSALNWVIGHCDGNFITLRAGIGTAPFDAAFADAGGQTNCIFAAAPQDLPIFSLPYDGLAPTQNTQSFNHDGYNIPIDVHDFGPQTGVACAIDFKGIQHSYTDSDGCHSTDGVDETASDILIDSSHHDVSVAAGRVVMAVPRFIPTYTPPGNDPYQREVFIRHSVGSGRYAEIFTTYYAHLQQTKVRRGDVVNAGTVLGTAGETGAAGGVHLHLGAFRNRNLSWRQSFEFDFSGGRWDRDNTVAAFDPWGWQAPMGVDPWAWRFRAVTSDPIYHNAGSYSTNMWKAGEAPPQN